MFIAIGSAILFVKHLSRSGELAEMEYEVERASGMEAYSKWGGKHSLTLNHIGEFRVPREASGGGDFFGETAALKNFPA